MFGAEFVAMKQSIGALRSLKYKIKMTGISTSDSSHIYENNMSVHQNYYSKRKAILLVVMQYESQLLWVNL